MACLLHSIFIYSYYSMLVNVIHKYLPSHRAFYFPFDVNNYILEGHERKKSNKLQRPMTMYITRT
jgi:hypothetical protein